MTCFQGVRLFARGIQSTCARPAAVEAATIDLNRARASELALLPGIGRGRAEAIILHRVRHGPFRRLEDLVAVDGIGEGTVAGLVEFVRVGVSATLPGHGTASSPGR